MRYILIFLISLTLSACQTQNLSYFQHYEYCMNQHQDMASISECGRTSRESHIAKSGYRPWTKGLDEGDQFAVYVDTLTETVKERKRSNSEARLHLLQTISNIKQNYMMGAAVIYGAQQSLK